MKWIYGIGWASMFVMLVWINILEAQICERMTFMEFCWQTTKILFERWIWFI